MEGNDALSSESGDRRATSQPAGQRRVPHPGSAAPTGTFIFAQAIGQLFDSTLPPAILTYAGLAAFGIGWWYLPRTRAVQIVVGAPALFLAAIGGLLLVVQIFGGLLSLAGIGGGHEHAAP